MKIMDMLGCLGWAAFLILASAWIPLFGHFFSLLTPLPFLYYSTKLGAIQGLKLAAMVVLAVGVISYLVGYAQGMLFCLEFSILGLALSEIFRRRLGVGYTVFLGTVFMLALGFVFLSIVSLSRGMGPLEMLLHYLQDNLKGAIEAYESSGMSPERTSEIKAYGEVFIETISKIYPSLMIVSASFVVWVNVVLAKPLFKMGKLQYPDTTPVDRWQAPDRLVWVVIVSGFALFFSSGGITWFAVNTLVVLMTVYLFHGLSILLYFLNKYRVPPWIRVGIYLLLVFQQIFLALLALAGLFDQWVDFRKLHKKTDK